MDSVYSSVQTSELGRSTFGLADGGGQGDDGEQERKQVVDLSALLARVERVLDGDEEVHRVAQVEADRHQLKQHVDVVVGDAEVLLVQVRQDGHVERQPVEHVLDVYHLLESVEVVAHQDDVEVGHSLQQ